MASGRQQFSIISDGLPTQLPDIDPDETREWVESFTERHSHEVLEDLVHVEDEGRRANVTDVSADGRARQDETGKP